MRRKDRQISREETEKILLENSYGILSIVCKDGFPYGIPVNYVYEDGRLYFHHTSAQSLFSDNVTGETKACFTVVGNAEVIPAEFSTNYESVIAFGKIKESADKYSILMKLVDKFSPDYADKEKNEMEMIRDKIKVGGESENRHEQGKRQMSVAGCACDNARVYEFTIESMTGKARKKKP